MPTDLDAVSLEVNFALSSRHINILRTAPSAITSSSNACSSTQHNLASQQSEILKRTKAFLASTALVSLCFESAWPVNVHGLLVEAPFKSNHSPQTLKIKRSLKDAQPTDKKDGQGLG
jgi:hypothetical protein